MGPIIQCDLREVALTAGKAEAGEVEASTLTAGKAEAGEVEASTLTAGKAEVGEVEASALATGKAVAGEAELGELRGSDFRAGEPEVGVPERPPSPCTKVCKLDAQGYCLGCLRTGAEIGQWISMSGAQQWALVAELAQRRRRV